MLQLDNMQTTPASEISAMTKFKEEQLPSYTWDSAGLRGHNYDWMACDAVDEPSTKG